MDRAGNGKRIVIGALDVTNKVADMYDAVVSSMDWGSAFLEVETCMSILIVGTIMGWETPTPAVKIKGINDNDYSGFPADAYRQRYDEREARARTYWLSQVRAAIESGELTIDTDTAERLGVELITTAEIALKKDVSR